MALQPAFRVQAAYSIRSAADAFLCVRCRGWVWIVILLAVIPVWWTISILWISGSVWILALSIIECIRVIPVSWVGGSAWTLVLVAIVAASWIPTSRINDLVWILQKASRHPRVADHVYLVDQRLGLDAGVVGR